LPPDDRAAKIEIGKIILSNKENSCAADICSLVIDRFGLKINDKEIEAKHKTISSLCACPANGLVYEVMNELGKVYFEDGNTHGAFISQVKQLYFGRMDIFFNWKCSLLNDICLII
jgi:hypothetical protein